MPEIVSDSDPFQLPQAAANEFYARKTPASIGSFVLGTLQDAGTAYLGRAAERGTVAGSSSFDQGLAALAAQGGASDQPLIAAPEPTQSPEIAPDQYNELYAPRDASGKVVPIGDKPMPEALAKIIGRHKTEAMERESALSRFAEAHWGPTTFIAGTLASMLDPINAGALFIPGVGEGAIAARLGGGLLGRTVGRLAVGAEVGAVAQAPVTALKLGLSPEEAGDYGIRDAMRDMLYGAAGVALLHTGIGTAGELLGRGAERAAVPHETPAPEAAAILSADAPTKNAAMRAATAQMVDGRPVDAEAFSYRPPQGDTALGRTVPLPEGGPIAPGTEEIAATARSLAPDAFAERDRLQAEQQSIREQIAASQPAPEQHPDIVAIDQRINELRQQRSEAKGAKARRQLANDIANAEAGRASALEGLPAAAEQNLAGLRQRLLETDYALRDLAPRIGTANAEAEQRLSAASGLVRPSLSPQDALSAASDALDRQRTLAREGWAPGVSSDELRTATEAVYAPKPEAETAPAAAPVLATPEKPGAASPLDKEVAEAEQRMSGVANENIAPEDRAELDRTAEAVTKADTMKAAYESAAACIAGLI